MQSDHIRMHASCNEGLFFDNVLRNKCSDFRLHSFVINDHPDSIKEKKNVLSGVKYSTPEILYVSCRTA